LQLRAWSRAPKRRRRPRILDHTFDLDELRAGLEDGAGHGLVQTGPADDVLWVIVVVVADGRIARSLAGLARGAPGAFLLRGHVRLRGAHVGPLRLARRAPFLFRRRLLLLRVPRDLDPNLLLQVGDHIADHLRGARRAARADGAARDEG